MDGATPIIVDAEDFDKEITSIEVVFTFIYGSSRVEPPDDFDYEGALKLPYNAYFQIQTEKYVFRNSWDEGQYGKDAEDGLYFNRLTGWDADNNAVDYGGTFTDAAIKGDGTYTVSLKLGSKKFDADDTFIRILAVSTDINSKLFKRGDLTITKATVKFDNEKTQEIDDVFVSTDGVYASIILISEYESAVGTEPFPYTMPTDSIVITFTIEGLQYEGPADKTALQERYDELKDLKKEDYTEESFKAFEEALNAAKAVLDDEEATQAEANEALNNLNKAYENLVKADDKGCKGCKSNVSAALLIALAAVAFAISRKRA
jgi:hypothetical protein